MFKHCILMGLTAMCCLATGCAGARKVDKISSGAFRSDFDDLGGWRDDSAGGSSHSYSLGKGKLRISTRSGTRDRVKVCSRERFGSARYSWRVYAPEMGRGDQASIGAFLYKDDKHEVDFEIGYGKASLRKKLNAKEKDLVCYCTSQGYPYSSSQILLPREVWHTLSIDVVRGENDKYLIAWSVNGRQVKELQTTFGDEITFTAHCSVENLTFIGDHIPTLANYALFDYVEIEPAVLAKQEAK